MDLSPDERRTQVAYDTVATDYAALLHDFLDENPWERTALEAFAGEVLADGGGPVLDAGCGPGRLTGLLRDLGLEVSGVDLSPAMVELARSTHPRVRFDVGRLAALDVAAGALAGVLCWYSVIHTAPAEQPDVYRELARVLRPGGRLLLGFQVGDERVRLEHAYGHDIDLDAHRLSADLVERQLLDAGFVITSRVEPGEVGPPGQRQAYLLARPRTAHSPRGTDAGPKTKY
ncbi:class I SAM-dependent DNA methyltransferase [Dermatobacter hominis]|uniref:class I SAM-dependent DNA methyltransferase n=1 Tax=Dermatobacter hominis TaxID=2884263 RepID=UPI001D116FA8|nr:class I SAM-dependent methyltransferase [Dermatobacter hominis]UDY36313.1 class I SAM-dependent methyltransferase [Dermatobacter hominis]